MHHCDVTLPQDGMIAPDADKRAVSYQHVHMHLSCPQCQTSYEVEDAFNNASVVCHRCGIEFSISTNASNPDPAKEPGSAEPVETGSDEVGEVASMEPPKREKARIWTWLIFMLILIAAGGFWLQKDAWMDNRWIRSTAINLGIPIALRDKDWSIVHDSVQAEWIIRDDGSKVLAITGRVKNLLSSELAPPIIEVTFFSKLQAGKSIASKRMKITLQPSRAAIRRTPYSAPAPDMVPVAPLGTREFVIVFEALPEETGDFTLGTRID